MKTLMMVVVLLTFTNAFAQNDSENVEGLTLEAPAEPAYQKTRNIDEEAAEITLSSEEVTDDLEQPASEKIKAAEAVVTKQAESAPKAEVNLGEVTGTQNYKITCILNDDVREITSITQADGSVGIVYKRFDEVKTIALAKTNPEYADQVADKIHNNLANGKYPYACTKE